MITFYDLAAKDSIKTWSPNPWKTRYVLNYKGLTYKTVPIEYPDLEPEFKKLGIPPNGTKGDGSPLYTSPSLIDDATNTKLSDSYKIAEYLDKAYPDSPKVIPPGTEALQAAFYDQFWQVISPIWVLYLPRLPVVVLNPKSAGYFTTTRTAFFGKPLADVEPKGAESTEGWKKVQAAFDTIHGWYSKSNGPYLMGEKPTFGDFAVAGLLHGLKVCFGENSAEWKNIGTWNNGKWTAYLASLDKYAGVEK